MRDVTPTFRLYNFRLIAVVAVTCSHFLPLLGSGVEPDLITPAHSPTVSLRGAMDDASREWWKRACSVYCKGPILDAVSKFRVYRDDKTFVDLPMKSDPEVVLSNFKALQKGPFGKPQLVQFLDENFGSAGDDLLVWSPTDWVSNPQVVADQADPLLKEWLADLNKIWLDLGRRIAPACQSNPQRHSLMPLPHPFVVPGGRFREVYYWDTLWIIRGLLISEMHTTAKGMILNLLSLIKQFGFVPNGSRVYYLNRSQPPLLSEMVALYFESTGGNDTELLSLAVPLLVQEHEFVHEGGRVVSIRGSDNGMHRLNRYKVTVNRPRPENYTGDREVAEGLSPSDASGLWSDIAAAAESGWDFSSRWICSRDGRDLRLTCTSQVVPVELNSYLYRMERNIAAFSTKLGLFDTSAKFEGLAKERASAMDAVMWNETDGQWFDYHLHEGKPCTAPSVSNFIPLWAESFQDDRGKKAALAVDALLASGLVGPAGVYTTMLNTTQQWDYPNAWAPNQLFIIEGLRNVASSNSPAAENAGALARRLTEEWMLTNYVAFKNTGDMHEKYDARKIGGVGDGGEYIPQTGFGWTNGVIFSLAKLYAGQLPSLSQG